MRALSTRDEPTGGEPTLGEPALAAARAGGSGPPGRPVTGRARASSRGVKGIRGHRVSRWRVTVLATLGAGWWACAQADSQRAERAGRGAPLAQGRPTLMIASGISYRTVDLDEIGRITGSVEFDGPTPADTVVHPTADADVCGQSLIDVSVDHRGPRLANAVVWLTGIVAGKAMPFTRRYDVTTVGCRIVPRVQAAAVGGTVNVGNADPATNRTQFRRVATGAVLAAIQETEAGAVVPSAAILAIPGLVEIRCDQHPWMRGWIAVFDHPYFTTTDANGGFVMDSVPPGRYEISVWHERFGTRTDSVTVSAGGSAAVALRFAAGSGAH